MEPGLYTVSTPIGNLKDITLRALETLKEVDIIACEDTRHTLKLLNHYNIKNKLISFNEFNKKKVTPKIIKKIKDGKAVALVSDAGTPGISDPGFYLIRQAIKDNLQVIPVPGPTAFVTALTVSGLPTNRFLFLGFLPRRSGRKRKLLNSLKEWPGTIIFYESMRRLLDTLKELRDCFGNRRIVIARELTKRFEELIRTDLQNIEKELERTPKKGEVVGVVEGVPKRG